MDLSLMVINLSDPLTTHNPSTASKPEYYASLFLFYSFFNLIRASFGSAWMIVEDSDEIDAIAVYSKPQLILNSISCTMSLIAIISVMIRLKDDNLLLLLTAIISIFIQISTSIASLISFYFIIRKGRIFFVTQGYLACTLSIILGGLSLILFSIDLIYLRNSKKAFN